MTLPQGLAFGLVGLTIAAFVWGRFRYDLIALGALLAGLVIGLGTPLSLLVLLTGPWLILLFWPLH